MAQVRCPHCDEEVSLSLEEEISLPPTGGDYDWCESWETHRCPACGQRMEVLVRVWLSGASTDVMGVRPLPPEPHPWAPFDLAFSPDGSCLAVGGRRGVWLLTRTEGGWGEPIVLEKRDAPRRQGRCPAFAWSRDGLLALPDGRVLDTTGAVVYGHAIDSLRDIVGFGWCQGQVVRAWRGLDATYSDWIGGLDRFDPQGAKKHHSWQIDSGFLMSGRVVVDEPRGVVWRLAPAFHGGKQWTFQRWEPDGEAWRMTVERTGQSEAEHARATPQGLVTAHTVWRDFVVRAVVEWRDPDTLELTRRLEISDGERDKLAALWDLIVAGGDTLLLHAYQALLRVRHEADQIVSCERLDLDSPRACAVDPVTGRVIAADDWRIFALGDPREELPMPGDDVEPPPAADLEPPGSG